MCCSTASIKLNLYQTFIFSLPIFFTLILLLIFYLLYLRRRSVNLSSVRLRSSTLPYQDGTNDIYTAELGLKKEVRELLPVIVYKESFFVRDTQCSVCLVDYQAEDKLQQIPSCGHSFHMDCIDLWLAAHATCPLCRFSILAPSKSPAQRSSNVGHGVEAFVLNEPQTGQEISLPMPEGEETASQSAVKGRNLGDL